MTPDTVNNTILRAAALLAPEQQRAEWLAEWRAELWHSKNAGISISLGAFQDAWWLRRHGPLPRSYGVLHLEAPAPPLQYFPDRGVPLLASPRHCLSFLAMSAVLAIAVAAALPASRDPVRFLSLLPGFFIGCLLAPITTSFSLGDYPKGSSRRRWLFLMAKILLIMPISVCAASLSPATVSLALIGGVYGMRWILEDQRQRCPICLRLLANPVRIGHASRTLLEWHGSELMCLRGHGLLHVPEPPSIWPGQQQWMDLDPSWSGLFPLPEK